MLPEHGSSLGPGHKTVQARNLVMIFVMMTWPVTPLGGKGFQIAGRGSCKEQEREYGSIHTAVFCSLALI